MISVTRVGEFTQLNLSWLLILTGIASVLSLGYGIWLWLWEAKSGKTPGNLMVGLRTTNMDGEPAGRAGHLPAEADRGRQLRCAHPWPAAGDHLQHLGCQRQAPGLARQGGQHPGLQRHGRPRSLGNRRHRRAGQLCARRCSHHFPRHLAAGARWRTVQSPAPAAAPAPAQGMAVPQFQGQQFQRSPTQFQGQQFQAQAAQSSRHGSRGPGRAAGQPLCSAAVPGSSVCQHHRRRRCRCRAPRRPEAGPSRRSGAARSAQPQGSLRRLPAAAPAAPQPAAPQQAVPIKPCPNKRHGSSGTARVTTKPFTGPPPPAPLQAQLDLT